MQIHTVILDAHTHKSSFTSIVNWDSFKQKFSALSSLCIRDTS